MWIILMRHLNNAFYLVFGAENCVLISGTTVLSNRIVFDLLLHGINSEMAAVLVVVVILFTAISIGGENLRHAVLFIIPHTFTSLLLESLFYSISSVNLKKLSLIVNQFHFFLSQVILLLRLHLVLLL